jgi:hypothetical protein
MKSNLFKYCKIAIIMINWQQTMHSRSNLHLKSGSIFHINKACNMAECFKLRLYWNSLILKEKGWSPEFQYIRSRLYIYKVAMVWSLYILIHQDRQMNVHNIFVFDEQVKNVQIKIILTHNRKIKSIIIVNITL